jgi:hypothetical protein
MGMQTQSRLESRSRSGPGLIAVGVLLLVVALVLYVSGASRAIGVWIAPVAVAALLLGALTLRGVSLPRWAIPALAVVAVGLAAMGVVTLVYSAGHQPTGAVPETQRPTP